MSATVWCFAVWHFTPLKVADSKVANFEQNFEHRTKALLHKGPFCERPIGYRLGLNQT